MTTYEQQEHPEEDRRTRALREASDCYQAFSVTGDLITEELGYVFDLEQYPGQDLGRKSEDPDRIQPIDLLLPNQWRYNTDKTEESAPIHINCKPTQRTDQDPIEVAEKVAQMRRALEHTLLYNPINNFEDVRARYIGGAHAGRLWCARWDWIPYLGEQGELIPRLVDPRNIMIPRGFLTPHDPLCPALFEIVRMPVNEALRKKGWNCKGLRSDSGEFSISAALRAGGRDTAESPFRNAGSRGSDSRDMGEGWATFLMVWRRFEPETRQADEREELDPDQRKMKCSACNYQTPPEVQVRATAKQAGQPFAGFPETTDACPQCETGVLNRQDYRVRSAAEIAFEKGKVLEIHCLNGSLEKEAFRGPWPCPQARSFPYLWLGAYRFPHRAVSESNVSWGWPISAARNFTNRVIFEQAHRSRPFTNLPDDAIDDRKCGRFDLGEDGDDVAFSTKDLPEDAVRIIQAQPVNEALFELNNMLATQFHGSEGNDQISIPAERTRDIAASSLQLQSDSGNVPINGFVRRLYAAESIWFGVLSDYIRHFWRIPRGIRYDDPMGQAPGGILWQDVYGPDLPNCDVTVGAGPDLSQLRSEELQAYKELMAYPKPMRRALGQAAGVDHYTLDMMDEVENAEAMMVPGAAPGVQPPRGQPAQPGRRPMPMPSPVAPAYPQR